MPTKPKSKAKEQTIPHSLKTAHPSFTSLIEKKRDGIEFSDTEIRFIVNAILGGEMPEFQMAALVMTIYFQGLSAQEIAIFSEEMILSGEVLDLTSLSKPKVGLYATGGVGDKSAIVLTALAASCGIIAPTMIGKDEDFVFGSLEKMSAIPGFRTKLTIKEFLKQLQSVGCCMSQQDPHIAPVDHILYDMRRHTSTIPNIPLIICSILSKKLAAGAENLVVDVKWGNGAIIKDKELASQLGRNVTRVARTLKRRCVALVTDMNQPLGNTVGTAIEIKEAIELLKGEGPPDLKELVLKLGMEMLRLSGVSGSTLSAKQAVQTHLYNGSALQKFKEMVAAQGGDTSYIDNPEKFPQAKHIKKLAAPKRGYVHSVNAQMVAKGVHILSHPGGEDSLLDTSVGVSQLKKVGVQVKQGEPLMMIHYNDHSKLDHALEYLRFAYRLAPKRPTLNELITERIA